MRKEAGVQGKGATPGGTARCAQRGAGTNERSSYRELAGLTVSSVGLGTYLGSEDEQTDDLYREAIRAAVTGGCNLIDTAINYRYQLSERAIGAALRQLAGEGWAREEIVICTKGGFIPLDAARPADIRTYFTRTFQEAAIASLDDIVAGCHVLTPRYLEHQLEQSLANLGLDAVDVYYIHNPEIQLLEVPRVEFLRRMRGVFEALEGAADAGKIRIYGAATWDGFRVLNARQDHLELEELVEIAHELAGDKHRFRVVQLPLNLALPEALTQPSQTVAGQAMPVLQAADALGVQVITSAALLQTSLLGRLPASLATALAPLRTDAQRCLQFARSAPGVTAALVGMKRREHVTENLEVLRVPPLTETQVAALTAG
jgi:aryl-alcohol dehydrogenase-like predicted oxidoreductase